MKIENNENILCEYGCGQLAKYVLKNGKTYEMVEC